METIEIHADGASRGNPGLAGAGALLRYGVHAKALSKGLGTQTNNVAELTAIQLGLEALTDTDKPIKIYSDSKYSIGVLSLGWKVNKNVELVNAIKAIMGTFDSVEFVWVKGHNGDKWNEEADRLANIGAELPEGEIKENRLVQK